jgi:hypothetical protein
MAEKTTSLTLTGFEIEVEDDPIILLMQTDKGPFSVEIPKTELPKLIYALRFVQYAEEPLRRKRERKAAAPATKVQTLLGPAPKAAKKPKRK